MPHIRYPNAAYPVSKCRISSIQMPDIRYPNAGYPVSKCRIPSNPILSYMIFGSQPGIDPDATSPTTAAADGGRGKYSPQNKGHKGHKGRERRGNKGESKKKRENGD